MLVSMLATVAAVAAAPAAATDLGWYGLEVRGGVVVPAEWDTGYAVAASADLGELAPGLRLYPGVGYSQADTSDSVSVFGTPFTVDQEVTSLEIGAEVRWFPSRYGSGWYFGGGPYLHRLEYEQAAILGGIAVTAEFESDEVGVQAVAGYSLGGRFNVEARYDAVSIFDGVRLLVGIRFGG